MTLLRTQELPEPLGNLFCHDEEIFFKNSSYKVFGMFLILPYLG